MIVDYGSPPEWLSGTLARHACGVYGETGGYLYSSVMYWDGLLQIQAVPSSMRMEKK